MVNLCNRGTKDFVELWQIIHLNMWIQQSITVKPVQTTTSIKQPMLSPPKQIPAQSLLSNTTSNHFFDSLMKKTRLKQLQNFIQQKMQKNKEQCICLSDNI